MHRVIFGRALKQSPCEHACLHHRTAGYMLHLLVGLEQYKIWQRGQLGVACKNWVVKLPWVSHTYLVGSLRLPGEGNGGERVFFGHSRQSRDCIAFQTFGVCVRHILRIRTQTPSVLANIGVDAALPRLRGRGYLTSCTQGKAHIVERSRREGDLSPLRLPRSADIYRRSSVARKVAPLGTMERGGETDGEGKNRCHRRILHRASRRGVLIMIPPS